MKTVGETVSEHLPSGMSFDYAVPQDWADNMRGLGVDPWGRFVWLYDDVAPIMGRPYLITDKYPDRGRVDHDRRGGE